VCAGPRVALEPPATVRETARLLRKDGTAVMVTVSNLSSSQMLRAFAKRALAAVRGDRCAHRVVKRGWRRTASEHMRLGRRSGRRVNAISAFDDDVQVTAVLRPAIARLLPLRPATLAVLWSRQ